MSVEFNNKPAICGICGRKIENESDSVSWLTGIVHRICKEKEQKKIKDDSDTVHRKEQTKL